MTENTVVSLPAHARPPGRRRRSTSSTSPISSMPGAATATARTTPITARPAEAMDLVFERCWSYVERGVAKEFVTGNNDADGVYFLSMGSAAAFPRQRADHIQAKLVGLGRQFLGRQRRQHRQPRHRPPRYLLVALRPRQRPQGTALLGDLAGHYRTPSWRVFKARSRGKIKGRCGASAATSTSAAAIRASVRCSLSGRPLGGRPGLLPEQPGDWHRSGDEPGSRCPGAGELSMRPSASLLACSSGLALLSVSPALGQSTRRRRRSMPGALRGLPRRAAPRRQIGPALLPGNLKRLRPGQGRGRHRQRPRRRRRCPAFEETAVRRSKSPPWQAWIYEPPAEAPQMGLGRHRRQPRQVLLRPRASLPADPAARSSDPLNLFVVVESGDHHVSIRRRRPLWSPSPASRAASRFMAGPNSRRTGRFVYFGSRDGWVTKYDLHSASSWSPRCAPASTCATSPSPPTASG